MGIFDFFRQLGGPKQLAPPRVDIDLTLHGGELADAMGDFALRVGRDAPGNLVCSGSSLLQAWIRVWAGARGQTRSELDAALGLTDEQATHAALGALSRALASAAEHVELRDANAVWVSPALALDASWETAWGDAVHALDFSKSGEAADTINAWVRDNTNGIIDNIVSAGQLSPATVLSLTNAIYFKAKWQDEFEEARTRASRFTGQNGERRVEMMHTDGEHECAATADFELLRRPYVGGQTELVIVLPRPGLFERVRSTLRYGAVRRAMDASESVLTSLRLPKFTLEASPGVDDVLRSHGVSAVYDTSAADLTGIANDGELAVGQTIHKARIEVDESGTEAAAATFIGMTRGGGPQPTLLPYEFFVDRPFLYFVIERTTQTPLFSGHIVDLN